MQHDVPLVSVVIPSYNSAASISVAVASVLAQSIPDLEIIIVDDASTDMTSSVVAQMTAKDKRISSIRLPRNSGPAAARNIGLKAARGVWIAPVDADDEIQRNRLQLLCEAGEAQSADMIADGVLFVGPCWPGPPFELSASGGASGELDELSIEALIRSDIPLNGSCSFGYLKPLMRRDFLQRNDLFYDEALWFAEDFNLYARALLCGARFLLHPESHYIYNQTPLSASRSEDSLPELARYALLGNERLRDLDGALQLAGLGTLLLSHRLRWSTVLWFNRLKAALRARDLIAVSKLLFSPPGGSRNMASFAVDRIRASSDYTRPNPGPLTTTGGSSERGLLPDGRRTG